MGLELEPADKGQDESVGLKGYGAVGVPACGESGGDGAVLISRLRQVGLDGPAVAVS